MTNCVALTERDRTLLRLLSWTPATTALLLRASSTFPGDPFANERRLRERLQSLANVGFVRAWSSAQASGGLQNYYKLAPAGWQALYGTEAAPPPKTFFSPISPSLFEHTVTLADVIVATVVGSHRNRVQILGYYRENELDFAVGDHQVQPDCLFRFTSAGRNFSVAFEVDLSTESINSMNLPSIRHKLQTYEAYQSLLLEQWRLNGRAWERPRFRVAFLTRTVDRAYHILSQASEVTLHKSRRLIYAAPLEDYIAATDPIRAPLFIDHLGEWRALVDLHPTAQPVRPAVRLPPHVRGTAPLG